MLVGASAPFSALAQVPSAAREAETALGIARTHAATRQDAKLSEAVRIDRIDLTTWLLSHVDERELTERIKRVLAPLEQPTLIETLVVYLAAGQNIATAAAALYVHPNTVRYRISRIEAEIGAPIGSVPAISDVVLALYPQILSRAEQLRRETSV